MNNLYKLSLEKDYDLALKNIVEKQYGLFFRNIRPAIEVFCKVVISELLGEQLSSQFLNGKLEVDRERGGLRKAQRDAVEGGNLIKAIPDLLPALFDSKAVKGNRRTRIKNVVERSCATLSNLYSIASAVGSHSGEKGALDLELQAVAHSYDLPAFFNALESDSIIESTTVEELREIIKPVPWKSQVPDSVKEMLKIKEEDLVTLRAQEAMAKQTALDAEKQALLAERKLLELEQKANVEKSKADEASRRFDEVSVKLKEIKEREYSLKQECDNLLEEREELYNKIAELQKEIEGMKKAAPSVTLPISSYRPKDFDVSEDNMDDDQLDLVDKTIDKSMLVAGCAGCGKSVIAIHKAQQIRDMKGDYIVIAYTKSLKNYMNGGKESLDLAKRFYYYWQWEKEGRPSADYIIVDEIQDFTESEIRAFITAAKKSFFFFGDTAQSIYGRFGRPTMSVEEISRMTGLDILHLHNNYRLPKGVAQVTQNYIGVGVRKYDDNTYKSKELTIPYFLSCQSDSEQINEIMSIINRKKMKNAGILVPSNESILVLYRAFNDAGFNHEFKYSNGKSDSQNADTLDFSTSKPKLMTFHSSKGLQFEEVFIPMFKGVSNDEERKALYVAMTRTYKYLFMLYTGDQIPAPLDCVPTMLYKTNL